MSEAYGPEHAEIAEAILARALEELLAAGLGHVEACHAMVHMGLDTMPAFACADCLKDELEAVAEAVDDRLEAIPTMGEIAQPARLQ